MYNNGKSSLLNIIFTTVLLPDKRRRLLHHRYIIFIFLCCIPIVAFMMVCHYNAIFFRTLLGGIPKSAEVESGSKINRVWWNIILSKCFYFKTISVIIHLPPHQSLDSLPVWMFQFSFFLLYTLLDRFLMQTVQ